MAWTARIVVPDRPHPVAQRGNSRHPTFIGDPNHEAHVAVELIMWARNSLK